MNTAEWIVDFATVYVLAGLIFSVPFLTRGIGRVNAAARGSGLGFRLLIAPGVVALWPLLLRNWVNPRD
jgi:hypothetical protein